MSRATLRKLGWAAKRVRVLMPVEHWAYLAASAERIGLDPADLVSDYVRNSIRAQREIDRHAINPDDDQPPAPFALEGDSCNVATGADEW
jgi:hypothetical protein